MAQAIWQKWISNAIAKTINMPGDVNVDDVKVSYLLSHELGLKGVTVYRDGSRHEQVLHITGNDKKEKNFVVKPSSFVVDYIRTNIKEKYVKEQLEKVFKESEAKEDLFVHTLAEANRTLPPMSTTEQSESEACPSCSSRLIITEGCNMCIECGFSSCASG
jgi:ribonucleoside-diphosphate reductase alpha chain